MQEKLSPKQKKIDANKNGKIDASDLAKLRAKKEDNNTDTTLPKSQSPKSDNLDITKNPEKFDNHVQIDTSWLNVGHTDEIYKVIPTFIPGDTRPQECQFTIMLASPEKGLELMRKSKGNLFKFWKWNDSIRFERFFKKLN